MSVDIPAGTTVVEAPLWCSPVNGEEWAEPGQPGARRCSCHPAPFLAAGEQETLEFGLRIDQVIPNAAGLIKISLPCQYEGGFYDDLKPANDPAVIRVNGTGQKWWWRWRRR
jgi:hypothetical protein